MEYKISKQKCPSESKNDFGNVIYDRSCLSEIVHIHRHNVDNIAEHIVRHIFDKNGGSLGTPGSVSYMFDNKGLIVVEREPGMDEDEMMMMALEAGAEDVNSDEPDVFEIYTAPNDFSAVREALEQQGLTFLSAEVNKIPQNTVAVTDPDTVLKIQKLLDMLEENDDVQNVYHNADLPEEEDEE